MRESWTDERMDDLKDQVKELGARMDTRLNAMEARFDSVDARLDGLQRTMIQFCGLMVAALIGLIATQTALFFTLV